MTPTSDDYLTRRTLEIRAIARWNAIRDAVRDGLPLKLVDLLCTVSEPDVENAVDNQADDPLPLP